MENSINGIRRFNVIAGFLHLVSMVGVLTLSNSFSLPLNATYMSGPPGTTFEAVVNAFPIKEDTRTDLVSPPVPVMVGEVIATEVGFLNNVSVDFGVYDMRQKNEASKDPAWASAHSQFPADSYGICWLNSLPQADSLAVKLLPSRDAKNGKTSDYCK